MSPKENQTAGTAGVQVFELTMDNTEDQDALNRQLRKSGESNSPSAMPRRKGQDKSTSESTEQKSRTNGRS